MEEKVNKKYVCECGREFITSNSFNGHKSYCKIHHQIKGTYDKMVEDDKNRHNKAKKAIELKNKIKDADKLLIWINEKHTCEKCGKVMTEKYGSGRFCSKSCSHSRIRTDEVKLKIKSSVNQTYNDQKNEKMISYYENPKKCCDCGVILDYEDRKKCRCQNCAIIHTHQVRSQFSKNLVDKFGGNINRYGVRGTAKYGWYKGFHCDSSFELAYVVYSLDHNIKIDRNHEGFIYIYKNEPHRYYPDFIVDDTYIELKNYWTDQVQAKIDYFPKDLKLKILYKKDINFMIKYCEDTYGKDYCSILYDKNLPSYLKTIKP